MNQVFSKFFDHVTEILSYQFTLGKTVLSLGSLIELLVLLVAVLVLERFLRRFIMRRVLVHTHLEPDLQFALSRFMGYCFILVGFFVAFNLASIDLSSLAIIAGGLGVGIGFGLQNVVGNFVSGLVILAERPIAIGHRVEVGGVAGRVTKINMRSTTVVTNDNITIIVPNSDFITTAVTNWSYGDPKVRLRLPVGVAYGTDVEKLRNVLLAVVAEYEAVLKDPAPSVRFLGFGDSSLNFEVAVWTITLAHNPTRFRSDLYFSIEKALRENHIEIPFPQRDLHIRSGQLSVCGGME